MIPAGMTEGALREAVRVEPSQAATAVPRLRLSPRVRWQLTQVAADFVTAFAAAMANYGLYLASGLGTGDFKPGFYTQINLAAAAITVFALHGHGAYRDHMGLLRIESLRRIIKATFSGVMLLLGLSFFLQLPDFSRLTVLMLQPTIALGLVVQRFGFWMIKDRARKRGKDFKPVLIYGAGETGRVLAQHLIEEHPLGLTPAGFLDDNGGLRGEGVRVGPGVDGERVPVLGTEADLLAVVRSTRAQAVFLAMPSAPPDRIAKLIARLEKEHIHFFCVPSAGDLLFSSLSFGQIAGMPVFSRRQPTANRVHDVIKRGMDILGASALLSLSVPVLAVSAILVRLTSEGPAFFRQDRIGLLGRPFVIFKLRTMRRDAPVYGIHPSDQRDQRVTPVGRWLRRLSIDELPQLWNVLRGEMSLVGPRPEMPFVVAGYNEIQRQRLTVKPGMTGLWQISADRAFKIHDNIQYDLYYVENRSMALDLAILLMTPFVLIARDRAM